MQVVATTAVNLDTGQPGRAKRVDHMLKLWREGSPSHRVLHEGPRSTWFLKGTKGTGTNTHIIDHQTAWTAGEHQLAEVQPRSQPASSPVSVDLPKYVKLLSRRINLLPFSKFWKSKRRGTMQNQWTPRCLLIDCSKEQRK